jgi:hypothetical protein
VRQPRDDEGVLIAGRRGSGKTQEALDQFSQRSFDEIPWVLLDFKGGDLVSRMPCSAMLDIREPVPTEPGVYIVSAEIEDHARGGPVNNYLLQIFRQGNCGIVIDELGMVGQHSQGLRLILTQGRSKRVPFIFCCQRPVAIDMWALSESEFIQVFNLQFQSDKDRIHEYIPEEQLDFDELRDLGKYHSVIWHYDAGTVEFLQPSRRFEDIYDHTLYRLPKYEEIPQPDPGARIRV